MKGKSELAAEERALLSIQEPSPAEQMALATAEERARALAARIAEQQQGKKLYPECRPWELEPYYSRHVSAMTSEELHSKAAIAEQLAWRDKRIAMLEQALALVRGTAEAATGGDGTE